MIAGRFWLPFHPKGMIRTIISHPKSDRFYGIAMAIGCFFFSIISYPLDFYEIFQGNDFL